jgi:hypothetical protein
MSGAGGKTRGAARPAARRVGPSLAQIVNAQNRLALMRRVPGVTLSVEHVWTLTYLLGAATTELYALGERIDDSKLESPAAALEQHEHELALARRVLAAVGVIIDGALVAGHGWVAAVVDVSNALAVWRRGQ